MVTDLKEKTKIKKIRGGQVSLIMPESPVVHMKEHKKVIAFAISVRL